MNEKDLFNQLVSSSINETTGYDMYGSRQYRRLALYLHLLLKERVSRAELVSLLESSHPSIINLVRDCSDQSILTEKETVRSSGMGRPSTLLTLDKHCHRVAALNISGGSFSLSIRNLSLEELFRRDFEVCPAKSFEENLSEFARECQHLLAEWSGIQVLGVIVPGAYNSQSDQVVCYRLPEFAQIRIQEFFQNHFPAHSLCILPDLDCALLGRLLRTRTLMDNICYVCWDEGLGISSFVNGRQIKGDQNFAGEIGHYRAGEGSLEELAAAVRQTSGQAQRARLAKAAVLALSEALTGFVLAVNPQGIVLAGSFFDEHPDCAETVMDVLGERLPYPEQISSLEVNREEQHPECLAAGAAYRCAVTFLLT